MVLKYKKKLYFLCIIFSEKLLEEAKEIILTKVRPAFKELAEYIEKVMLIFGIIQLLQHIWMNVIHLEYIDKEKVMLTLGTGSLFHQIM